MTHRIYFEKRCIVICPPDDAALADPNAVEFHIGDKLDLHTLVGPMLPPSPEANAYL